MSELQNKTSLPWQCNLKNSGRINLKTQFSSNRSVLPIGVTYCKVFLSSTDRSKLPMASLDQAIL